MKKVLIIGGGFAGLECARLLANNNDFAVTLLDRNNHHLFQPLLYQVASASLTAPDIAQSIRQILSHAKNVTVLMDEINHIDIVKNQATGLSGSSYNFDYLVLASGARTGYFGNDQWSAHTMCLKSLADAQNIRRLVLTNLEKAEMCIDDTVRKSLMTITIVGGGPTGVELAGAFADLTHRSLQSNYRRIDTSKINIVLIEGSERILEAYSLEQSEYARQRLESLGVKVMTLTRVTDITSGKLHLKSGDVLESSSIIWAAGVAASPLAAQLTTPADRGGRITPLPDLSIPGYPHIFAAGDLVNLRDANDQPIPGIAPAAMQMGRHIAKVLLEDLRLSKTQFANDILKLRLQFHYKDKGFMAIIGKNNAVVKSGKMELQGKLAWLMWLFIHILFLVGFRNKLAVLLGWAFAYIKDNPSARVIVNTPVISAVDSAK
jgi:NADH:ubiquinone reductase (H+-translocating)